MPGFSVLEPGNLLIHEGRLWVSMYGRALWCPHNSQLLRVHFLKAAHTAIYCPSDRNVQQCTEHTSDVPSKRPQQSPAVACKLWLIQHHRSAIEALAISMLLLCRQSLTSYETEPLLIMSSIAGDLRQQHCQCIL